MSLFSAVLLLFLVIDPIGNVPFYLSALKNVEPRRQYRVILRELLIAYAAMIVFLFAGQFLLRWLQITEPALTISGGVVLFLIALRMVFPSHESSMREDLAGEPFVVPLAIPYVAGPSVLAAELLLMNREPARWPEWLAAVTLAWVGTAAILLLGARLRKILGERGLIALERLMGMVLVALAVQMFLSGVERYVRSLQGVVT